MAAVFVVVVAVVHWAIKRRKGSGKLAERKPVTLSHGIPLTAAYIPSQIHFILSYLVNTVQRKGTTNVSPAELCGEAQTKGGGRAADCRY